MRNSLSSIDLIFTDQPGIVADSGVHPTLHEITNCKLNLKVEYPPPYESLIWDFKRADVNTVTTAINQVDWQLVFSNKNVQRQVNIFNKSIINIFSNFIPNKHLTFDDKNPPWMTEKLKEEIKWKDKVYRDYLKKWSNQSRLYAYTSCYNRNFPTYFKAKIHDYFKMIILK